MTRAILLILAGLAASNTLIALRVPIDAGEAISLGSYLCTGKMKPSFKWQANLNTETKMWHVDTTPTACSNPATRLLYVDIPINGWGASSPPACQEGVHEQMCPAQDSN